MERRPDFDLTKILMCLGSGMGMMLELQSREGQKFRAP